jgi:serine/threonine protein kinase
VQEGIADLILKMTDKNPRHRPTARDVEEFFSNDARNLLANVSVSSRSSGSSRCSSGFGKTI